MTKSSHAARVAAVAGMASLALVLGACGEPSPSTGPSSGTASGTPSTSGEKLTLTVATFSEFGYADLYKEYMKEHPNVTIVEKKAATGADARTNMMTKLAAGSGLSDIEAVGNDWIAELLPYADKFNDLGSPDINSRWADWVNKMATAPDGTLIGYGTDLGPMALCYRGDLFAKAGLPSDRDAVTQLLGGKDATWERYFEVGHQFQEKSGGVKWLDATVFLYQPSLSQLPVTFENTDGSVLDLATNEPIKKVYDLLTAPDTVDLSAHLAGFSPDWVSAFQQGSFATMLCPAWMTTIIEGNSAGVVGWDMADVVPGGGANSGGSYLTVPKQTKHPDEAKALAAWLTAPEQGATVFTSVGNYPSQIEAQNAPDVKSKVNPFFNNAPVGQIYASRAAAITGISFRSENYQTVRKIVNNAINRVDIDQTDDPATSWDKAVQEFNGLGLS